MSALEEFTFAFATSRDLDAVKQLLNECKLPSEDVDQHLRYFILARHGEWLAGAVGMEFLGSSGLFRSLAIRPEHRGKGLGPALCRHMVTRARSSGMSKLYLITDGAEKFFEKFGFAPLERAKLPAEVRGTAEFRTYCPESASVMVKELG
jgi:amino-acid N-acetyltransferase